MVQLKDRLLLLLFGLWLSSPALALACPHSVMQVNISSKLNPATYDYTESKWGDGSAGGDIAGNVHIEMLPDAISENGCTLIRAINLKVTSDVKIRVSNRYAKGSCEHQVIQAHEAKHLALATSFFSNLNGYASVISKAIPETGVPAAQTSQLQQQLQQAAVAFKEAVLRDHATLQYQQVDSPEHMKAELAKCQNW